MRQTHEAARPGGWLSLALVGAVTLWVAVMAAQHQRSLEASLQRQHELEAVGPEACPFGAVRMMRGAPWICLTEAEADQIAEACYLTEPDCRPEDPHEHQLHGDGALECRLELEAPPAAAPETVTVCTMIDDALECTAQRVEP